MKLPVIRESYILNIFILVFSLFVSWFSLLFGGAHLVEAIINPERDPDIPYYESIMGWIMIIGLCLAGVIFLLIAIASIKGIIYKIKKKRS